MILAPAVESKRGAHDYAWLIMTVSILIGALIRSGLSLASAEAAACVVLHLIAWRQTVRPRMLLNLMTMFWFYFAVERIAPALRMATWDDELLAVDRWLFGESPAITFGYPSGWIADLLCMGYLCFHIYLFWQLFDWWVRPSLENQREYSRLLFAFSLAYTGYYLLSAIGPGYAHKELYTAPIEGSWITSFIMANVEMGTCGFDVFPSMHVGATLLYLESDFRMNRRRFALMLIPALLTMTATITLRFHYASDAIAGALIAVALRLIFPPLRNDSSA